MTDELYDMRFGGTQRLYGAEALQKLKQAHMAVVGLGGVGSWAAEALARSGVGAITLIELDEVCVSNTNRQSHALQSNIGRAKIEVIAERLRDINPDITLHCHTNFLTTKNIKDYIHNQDVVIDAMDSVNVKSALAAYCSAAKIRLVITGSSGGKSDPTRIQVADLGHTESDPMLAKMRSQLYRHHNFSRDKGRKFRMDAVYSTEQMVYPKPDGSVCMDKSALDSSSGVKLDCSGGFGSSVMVTGSFAFVAVSRALQRYLGTMKKN